MNLDPTKNQSREASFVQVLAATLTGLIRYRKRIILSTFAGGICGLILAFSLPKIYRTSTVLLIGSSSKQSDLSSLAGNIEGSGLSSLLGGSIGNKSASKEIFSLISTTDFSMAAIDSFRLDTAWDLKRTRWEPLVKAWNKNFSAEEDDNGAITIEFKSKDSTLSRLVTNWAGNEIEKRYQQFKKNQIESEFAFLKNRVEERRILFRAAEDSLVAYQQKYRIFAPEEQVKALSQFWLEKEREKSEIDQKIELLSEESGPTSQPVKYLSSVRSHINQSIQTMLKPIELTPEFNKSIPSNIQKALEFTRRQREVVLHGKVYAYLVQQEEQAYLEKQKNVPILRTIDPTRSPTIKAAPPRAVILAIGFFFGFVGSCLSILFGDAILELRKMVRENLQAPN